MTKPNTSNGDHWLYSILHPKAEAVKIAIQMFIGVAVVVLVALYR